MRLQRFFLTLLLLVACTHAFPSKPEYEHNDLSKEQSYHQLNKVPKTPAYLDDQIEKEPAKQDTVVEPQKPFDNELEENEQVPLTVNNMIGDNDSTILETEPLIQTSSRPPSKDKSFKAPGQSKAEEEEEAKYEYFWTAIPLYVWILIGIIVLCACVIPGLVMCSWCVCPCALLCCTKCEVQEVAVAEV